MRQVDDVFPEDLNGCFRESEPPLRPFQHSFDGRESPFVHQPAVKRVGIDVNGYLVNVLLGTRALLPHMHQFVAGNQHQIQVTDGLPAVSNRPFHAGGILNEVDLILVVTMSRVLEVGLVPFADIKDVQGLETRDFVKKLSHNSVFFPFRDAKLRKKNGFCKEKNAFFAEKA